MTDAEKIRLAVEEDTYVGDVASLLARELARVARERDVAIRRQIWPVDDERDRWFVADQARVEEGERLGPFPSEHEAFKSVLAWVSWAADPKDVPVPKYRILDGEGGP